MGHQDLPKFSGDIKYIFVGGVLTTIGQQKIYLTNKMQNN